MAKALAFIMPSSFTDPLPGTPFIEDPEWPTRWTLEASSLNLTDGSPVNEWIANGTAPLNDRRFAAFSTEAAGWDVPQYSVAGGPGGGPAVVFDGNARLANTRNTDITPQPITIAGTIRVDEWGPNNASAARIWAGSTGGYFISLLPGNAAASLAPLQTAGLKIQFSSSSPSSAYDLGLQPSGWFSFALSLDGTTGIFCLTGIEPVEFALTSTAGAQQYSGPAFGGNTGENISSGGGQGLKGAFAEMRRYSRSYSADGVKSIVRFLDDKHGI